MWETDEENVAREAEYSKFESGARREIRGRGLSRFNMKELLTNATSVQMRSAATARQHIALE